MNLQKLKPWNWFKREEPETGELLPVRRGSDPLSRMHQEMDRLFDQFMGTGMAQGNRLRDMLLKPSVDVSEGRKAYRIEVEVPGVEEQDMELTLDGNDLIIAGEKHQETEEDDEGYHRVERAYGQFRRILTLPDDADVDNISAKFRHGVLKIKVPRLNRNEGAGARRIKIES